MEMHKLKLKNLLCSIYSLKKESISKKMICEDCNIILVDIDCLRADHLGCYGYPKNTTPNIDKLAKDSMLFKNFFIEGSMTTLSKMSIYTSLYPHIHEVKPSIGDDGEPSSTSLNNEFLTLSQILKQNGYLTTWVGPLKSPFLSIKSGFGNGFDFLFEGEFNETFDWNDGLKWIKANKNKKFFVSFYSSRTHAPYTPTNETLHKFTNRTNIKTKTIDELEEGTIKEIINNPYILFNEDIIKQNPKLFLNEDILRNSLSKLCNNYSIQHSRCDQVWLNFFWKMFDPENSSSILLLNDLYDSEINEADQDFEGIIKLLEQENLLDKTTIIFHSDHGDEFWEHGSYGHGTRLYDEIIHAPLIIFIPGIEGKEIDALAQGVDIIPTILDLVGIKTPKQTQGKSLLPLILGYNKTVRGYAYSQSLSNIFSIRSKEWKYITNFGHMEELYNLKQDPGEKENLINTNLNKKLEMREKLEEHLKEFENKEINKKRLNTSTFKKVLIIVIVLLIIIVVLPKKCFKIKTN